MDSVYPAFEQLGPGLSNFKQQNWATTLRKYKGAATILLKTTRCWIHYLQQKRGQWRVSSGQSDSRIRYRTLVDLCLKQIEIT